MKYDIAALATDDLAIAQKHDIGGEKKLWGTVEPAFQMGEVQCPADGSGVWTANSINVNATTGAIGTLGVLTGVDLVCAVHRQLNADDDATVKLQVTFADDSTGFAVATFTAPSWVSNKSSSFEHGITRDLKTYSAYTDEDTNTPVTKTIKTIHGLSAITNAKRFSGFTIWQLPQSETAWEYISHVETFDPNIGTNPGIPIPDGLEGTSEVVRGRSEPSSLDITALHRSFVDGLMRFAGKEVCVRCETWGGGAVVKERQIAVNCVLQVNPTFPDGNEMVKNVARGFMGKWFGFWAG